jgi:3-phosphoshikimate 1-carboxyvinyltransferase
VRFDPVPRPLRGELRPPADKSISHRVALVGAMCEEPVRVRNYLDAADTNATLTALGALGVTASTHPDELRVRGVGLRGVAEAEEAIDVGNSGTLLRLLPGWLAGQREGVWTLDGDHSIRRRPVDRVAEPLRRMGAGVCARDGRLPPLRVAGARLRGISYALPMASAQVKSCVLLAGLLAGEPTTVIEPAVTRDHTERLLSRAGAVVHRDGARITVSPADHLALDELEVPGDLSSAAFTLAAAAVIPGSHVVALDVGLNWTRTGFVDILARMGARVEGAPEERAHASADVEPVGDLEVRPGELRATVVEAEEVPRAIDELPLVALLGCFAEGETVVRGAGELRVKESDRIASVVNGLRDLGADIEATADGFAVRGRADGLRGGTLRARGDHRLAMLGAIAGLASREGVEVEGMGAAEISYPGFVDDLGTLH